MVTEMIKRLNPKRIVVAEKWNTIIRYKVYFENATTERMKTMGVEEQKWK